MSTAKDKHADYYANRDIEPSKYVHYRLPAYLKQVIGNRKDLHILDIGCGLGRMIKTLSDQGYNNVSGIDVSADAVNACKQMGLDVHLITSIESFASTHQKKYDLITMSHVLEHLDKAEMVKTLSCIREQLLAAGGSLIVMVPNAQSNTGAYWAYEDFTHTTLFTAGSLHYVLRAAGYTEVNFLDPKGTAGFNPLVRFGFSVLLAIYKMNKHFWNLVTLSSFHKPSPQIYTFEIKAQARCL